MSSKSKDVSFVFKKFNITKMSQNTVILACARRNSGKSVLIREILYHLRDIPMGYVISATEEANNFFTDFVPSIFIRSKYNGELVRNLIERQKEKIKQAKHDPSVDPRAFLVLDDCLHDSKKWAKDDAINEIFFNGRHYKITFIFTMQYPVGIPPILRANIDYVFLLSEPIYQNKKKLFDCYAGIFGRFDVFSQALDQVTENFGVMCIHNSSRSRMLAEVVTWYRAKDPGPFKTCCEKAWRLDEASKLQREKEGAHAATQGDNELELLRNAPRVFVRKLMDDS